MPYKRPTPKGVAIPSGTYEGVVMKVEEKPRKFQDQPEVEGLLFTYLVALPQGGSVELGRHVTLTVGQKSSLRKDLVALFGEEGFLAGMKNDETFNAMIESCVGKSALLVTELRTSTNGNQYTNVTGIVPMPPGYSPKAVAGTPEPTQPKNGQWCYDISGIAKAQKGAAEQMLTEAGATWHKDKKVWVAPIELPKLVRFRNVSIENDEIPF